MKGLSTGMYHWSCGSIPKRGVHYAKKYIERCIHTASKWHKSDIKIVAQLDIKKCYPSIRHAVVKAALKKKFRGKWWLSLCGDIIDSSNEAQPGEEPRGVPIGFFTSQWFCNFLLTPIDHFIKETLRVKYYCRYMDDMVLFGSNKKEMHKIVDSIIAEATKYGLTIKSNWQIYRFDYFPLHQVKRRGRDINMIGFRFFRDKTIMRKRRCLVIKRFVKRIHLKYVGHRNISPHMAQSFISTIAIMRHCNSKNFYMTYVKPFVKIKKVKEIISNESRKHNYADCSV